MSHLRNYCSVQSRQAAGVGLTRNSNTMTASILRLTELHVKVLEQILLHFPGHQDGSGGVFLPPHTIWYWISDARFRSVHNSRTYLVIRRHFGTDVIFSLPEFPKTLVIPAILLNGENYASSVNVDVRCGEDSEGDSRITRGTILWIAFYHDSLRGAHYFPQQPR